MLLFIQSWTTFSHIFNIVHNVRRVTWMLFISLWVRLDFLDGSLCFQHLHDDLLFFDEERSHYPFTDTLVTARSTVRARDSLETLGHPCPLLRTRWSDSVQFNFAVAAFRNRSELLDVMVHQLTSWSLHYSTAIGVSVVTQPTAQRQPLRTHFSCLGVFAC